MTFTTKDVAERIEQQSMPIPECGCVIWLGALNTSGYGQMRVNGKLRLVHSVTYERKYGAIPNGLEPDHKCRIRPCINPDHIEPVTKRVNILRGVGASAKNARKTHCVRGHSLDPASPNVRVDKRGKRWCRTCDRERVR